MPLSRESIILQHIFAEGNDKLILHTFHIHTLTSPLVSQEQIDFAFVSEEQTLLILISKHRCGKYLLTEFSLSWNAVYDSKAWGNECSLVEKVSVVRNLLNPFQEISKLRSKWRNQKSASNHKKWRKTFGMH